MTKQQEPNYTELEHFISRDRLSSYRTIVRKRSPKNLIAAYYWNKHVSSTLYPILQCLEVTLRNGLHQAASAAFKTSSWYELMVKLGGDEKFVSEYSARWEDDFYRKSAGYQKEKGKRPWVSNHENMLNQTKGKLERNNKPVTAANVVAATMFGFWVSFFEDAYAGTDPKKSLWPHLESKVFIDRRKVKDRKQAHSMLEQLQQLRNRMSHHEPIWKSKLVHDDDSAVRFLNDQVDLALKLIGSLSGERYKYLVKSGKVAHFRGVCSLRTLKSYLKGDVFTKFDKRKVKRLVCREISQNRATPTIIEVQGRPKFIVDIWPG